MSSSSESVSMEVEEGKVPQTKPLDGRQVENNAGGFVYKIDDMARFKRFLILGSESGNYYVTEHQLKMANVQCLGRLLLEAGQGEAAVKEIVAVSTEGRAAKQGPGIFALAVCARRGDLATRRAAFAALGEVCRTASTLFEFIEHSTSLGIPPAAAAAAAAAPADGTESSAPMDTEREDGSEGSDDGGNERPRRQKKAKMPKAPRGKAGWGRAMRNAVAAWYLSRAPMDLAYQITKYRCRKGE